MINPVRKLLARLGLRKNHSDENQAYDDLTEQVILRVLGPGDRGVDIGCNRGLILQMMLKAAPDGPHIAFEPIPALAETLRKRFPKVNVIPKAVSRETGRASFNHVTNDDGYSGLKKRTYDRPDPRIELIEVDVTTLSAAITDGVPIRFLKIDIEGGEYDALVGGRNLISADKPVVVFEAGFKSSSHYGAGPEDFETFFSDLDFSLFTLERWLTDDAAIPQGEFAAAWEHDYYFLAAPNA